MTEEEMTETITAQEAGGGDADAGRPKEELEAEIAQLLDALAVQEEELSSLREELSKALNSYRETLLEKAPEVPEELVKGETVEEMDASFAAAREMVERVRGRLEAKAQMERVPTGAPARTSPDLSSLSPMEKIAHGLSRK